MLVTSAVIEVDTSDSETSINTQLASLAIPATDFLEAKVLAVEEKNRRAKIVIFYTAP